MPEPQVSQAHLMGVLSLASDHLMGQHPEWGLRSTLLAMSLAERLGVADPVEVRAVTLLRFVGCTSDAPALAGAFSDDIAFRQVAATFDFGKPQQALPLLLRSAGQGRPRPTRVATILRVLAAGRSFPAENFRASCEVADQLTGRLALPDPVRRALGQGFERWDGLGFPRGTKGGDAAPAARLALLATDAVGLVHDVGRAAARELIRSRAGGAHDPQMSAALDREWDPLLDDVESGPAWDRVTADPGPTYRGESLEQALSVVGDFADLKSVHLAGHSIGVAELASAAGARLGLDERELLHAGLVHDLGRCTVSSGIWDHPGPLSHTQREEVRLHSYRTERLLVRAGYLAELGRLAGSHHERLDGSGYHRGSDAQQIPLGARVLAAADVYQALTSGRAHRSALAPREAAGELRRTPGTDGQAVEAVLGAAGHVVKKRRALPAGLSEREVEVLALVAKGLTNQQIGRVLFISPKTAGHHVQHAYAKAGVSTRGAATLWAVQHGLV